MKNLRGNLCPSHEILSDYYPTFKYIPNKEGEIYMNSKKQGIELIEAKDYEELSQISAKVMLECIQNKPDALFCLATGSSPARAYEIFIELVNKEQISTQQLRILKLDEWWKINENDPSTCETFIQTRIIKPLNIPSENYISFNSDALDATTECNRIAQLIKDQGPIDLCILGIGKNGHLGLNEPGDSLLPFCHPVELSEKTKTHAMLEKTSTKVDYGMTIGMADIIASEKVLFIASGEEKKTSFNTFLKAEVRTDLPASILWLHPSTLCVYESKLLE
jgi:galactosamine-6-phosphate isomerase